jgi:hypothetical protein
VTHVLFMSWLLSHSWGWDVVPNATSYRIYWGASGIAWCSVNHVDVPATACANGRCQGEIPMPDFTPAYIVVTALNEYGESITEYGNVIACLR